MVKSLLRPLFNSKASRMMPTFTAGNPLSLLPAGAAYYDVTQERQPDDITNDITNDITDNIEVIKEPEKDPINNNSVPSGPDETSKEIAKKETDLNTKSMTTNETIGTSNTNEASRDASNNEDITTYIDNDSLDRISNYKNIIQKVLGDSSGGNNLQKSALLLQLGSSLMSGRTEQPGLRGFFDIVGQAGAQVAPTLFEMGIQKQKADREISSAALDLYFAEIEQSGDRSGKHLNVYQTYETNDDGQLRLDSNNKPIKLENPIRLPTVKLNSPEETRYSNLNQNLGFNMYEFVDPGEGADALGIVGSDQYLSVGKEDSAAQAKSLDYAQYLQRSLPVLAKDIIPMLIENPTLMGSRGALGKALAPYYETLKEFEIDLLDNSTFTVNEAENGSMNIPGMGNVDVFIDYNNAYDGNQLTDIQGGEFGSIDVSGAPYGYDANDNPIKAYVVDGAFSKMLKSGPQRTVLQTFENTLGLMLARDRQPTGRMLADVLKRSFEDVALTGKRAAGGVSPVVNYVRIYNQLFDNMGRSLTFAGRNPESHQNLYKIEGSKQLENAWYDYLTKDGRGLNSRLKFDISGGQSRIDWQGSNSGNIQMNYQENQSTSGDYYENVRQSLGL